MKTIAIAPVMKPFRASVRVPGSKSITNRALPIAAMAKGASILRGVLFADDTWQMIRAMQGLGYRVEVDEGKHSVSIVGCGREIPNKEARLHCGNSGTTIRFLAAMLTLASGSKYGLDGIARMRERPIGQLVDQLKTLGAKIGYAEKEGFPPIEIDAMEGLAGGVCSFSDARSSQYISAVLMAAPYTRKPTIVELQGAITSEPYVTMTLRMMEQFGVKVNVQERRGVNPARVIGVPQEGYGAREYEIEPDASNASYFLAAAAVVKDAVVTIEGLGKDSLQGDIAFADVLHEMGAGLVFGKDFVTVTGTGELTGIDIDMNHIPDMVQTLAVAALFVKGTTSIRNVGNLRLKETDRLAALEAELAKFGARVITTKDSITVVPPEKLKEGVSVATYDDHRMAMAFAVAGLKVAGVEIQEPGCVGKTYPDFFADFARAVEAKS